MRKEIEKLKDNNNRLRTKNLDLINMIKTYKSKETQLFFTEEKADNLKMKEVYRFKEFHGKNDNRATKNLKNIC